MSTLRPSPATWTMPSITVPLSARGPIIDLAVAISAPRRAAMAEAGLAIPTPVAVKGLVDTGASCTVIDPAVVQELGLTPTGRR